MISASGTSDSSRCAAASPAIPRHHDDDRLHAARLAHELGERADEHGVVVQRGRALEPHAELVGSRASPDVDVEQDLHVVRDEPDGHADDVSHAARGQRARCSPSRARPTARAYARRTGSSTTSARRRAPRARPRGARSPGTARRRGRRPRARAREGCARVKTTCTRSRSVLRPAREALAHPRRERLDQPGASW